MPDGTHFGPRAGALGSGPSVPAGGVKPRWARAAALAAALHLGAVLPLVLVESFDDPPSASEAVEVAPAMDEAGPQATEAENVAEAVPAASPEPVMQAATVPEPATAPSPEPPTPATTPPEPLVAAAPPPPDPVVPPPPERSTVEAMAPEPLPTEAPEAVAAEAPQPDSVAMAALPPPPPPMPPAPVTPVRPRAAPSHHAPVARAAPVGPPAEAPTAAAAAAPSPAPAAVPRRPPAGYIGALLAALERHKDYPSAARFRHAEGVALLRFAMRRDGTVASWRIERSSGDQDLDAAVGQMVRRASPLPPPPSELPGDPIELVVPVRFLLRR
jgi:periplasmic protein TonB